MLSIYKSPTHFTITVAKLSYIDTTNDRMGEIVLCKQQCTEVSE